MARQPGMEMSRGFLSLLETGDYSDCIIECNDGDIYAHQAILAAQSPVINNLLRDCVGGDSIPISYSRTAALVALRIVYGADDWVVPECAGGVRQADASICLEALQILHFICYDRIPGMVPCRSVDLLDLHVSIGYPGIQTVYKHMCRDLKNSCEEFVEMYIGNPNLVYAVDTARSYIGSAAEVRRALNIALLASQPRDTCAFNGKVTAAINYLWSARPPAQLIKYIPAQYHVRLNIYLQPYNTGL